MRALLLVLLFLPPTIRAADFSSAARGTTAADFLSVGVGARAMALGGAYSAVVDDAGAMYWNPAALTLIPGKSVTLMHAAYFSSSFFDYASYGHNLGRTGAVGVSLQYFSAGSIAQTDSGGYGTGESLSPHDLALSLGYAYGGKDWGGFSAGLAGKYIQSQVVDSAQTMAVDWGVMSPSLWGDRLRLALTASNLGGALHFDQAREALPILIKSGAAYRIPGHWTFSLDEGFPRDDSPYTALGAEYLLTMKDGLSFAARGGFNTQTLAQIGGISGVAMGWGANFGACSVDYAFVPYGSIGIAHRLSLSWSWGPTKEKRLSDDTHWLAPPSDSSSKIVPKDGQERLRALVQGLKTGDNKTRAEAAVQLGKLHNDDAVDALITALSDESIAVRGAAADALGKIGNRKAGTPLADLLRDLNPKVRALAARALGTLGDPKALPLLNVAAAHDPDPMVRKMASAAFQQLRPAANLDELLR